ncbi:MAG: nitroreductase family protein [Deltaproteobacteria bacterium]|nr:nitroreductase family protein [Deltaproteobacteria bacterium]
MELTEAIKERRSVRKFTDYYVTDEEIKELLEAARWAPSWGNTQTWEFIVVRASDLIEKITGIYGKLNPAIRCSMAASALIIGCAKTGISGTKKEKESTKFSNWFMFDLGMAVQNLCLRAHDLGLGTVIVGLMDHDACKDMIKLPEGYEVVVSIPVGKPAVKGSGIAVRKNLENFVHRDTFGTPFFRS